MRNVIGHQRESSIDNVISSSRHFPSTFVAEGTLVSSSSRLFPRLVKREGWKLSYDVTATLSESRSIWKQVSIWRRDIWRTWRRPRKTPSSYPRENAVLRASGVSFPPFLLSMPGDKALFQDFPRSLHRPGVTYRLLTDGQGLIPWRWTRGKASRGGRGVCTKSRSFILSPARSR